MSPTVLIAIIIASILVVLVLLISFVPQIRNLLFPSKKESEEESAKEAIKEIIVTQTKESKLEEEIKKEKYQNYLIQKEKELDIILSSDDIDPLIIQLIQDEKDNKK